MKHTIDKKDNIKHICKSRYEYKVANIYTDKSKERTMRKIMITWDGPYSLDQLEEKTKHLGRSRGIYQIYGAHPIYGSNVLLYIGKTIDQTFYHRIKQEKHWQDNPDRNNVQIYTGRLFQKDAKNINFANDISLAEQLLIYTHRPAHNSSNINTLSREDRTLDAIKEIRIINWHYYRDLMPEVSGDILVDETEVYADEYIVN